MKSQQKAESKENLSSEYGCSFCKNLIKHRDENSKPIDLECDFYGCFLSSVEPFGCKFFSPLDFLIHGTGMPSERCTNMLLDFVSTC